MHQKVQIEGRKHWILTLVAVAAAQVVMAGLAHFLDFARGNFFLEAAISVPVIGLLLFVLVIRPVERELAESSSRIVGAMNERLAVETRYRHEIQSSEARYRSIVEDLTEMVVRRDVDGKVTFVNPAFLETFGLEGGDVLGRPLLFEPHPEDRPIVEEKLRQLGASAPVVKVWHRVETSHGVRWQTWTHRAILGPDREVAEIQSVGSDTTAIREIQDQISESRAELRDLAHRLFALQEEERRLVAKEIHDGLCQSLTALAFQIAFLKESLGAAAEEARGELQEINTLLESTISAARALAWRLRPGILDDLGLADALRVEARRFSERTRVACDVLAPEHRCTLSTAARSALFRIAQEALANVEAHSGAARVTVTLDHGPEGLRLTVEDDGRGIDPARVSDPRSQGLLGMRERALALQGNFTIEPRAAGGTSVRVEVPASAGQEA